MAHGYRVNPGISLIIRERQPVNCSSFPFTPRGWFLLTASHLVAQSRDLNGNRTLQRHSVDEGYRYLPVLYLQGYSLSQMNWQDKRRRRKRTLTVHIETRIFLVYIHYHPVMANHQHHESSSHPWRRSTLEGIHSHADPWLELCIDTCGLVSISNQNSLDTLTFFIRIILMLCKVL